VVLYIANFLALYYLFGVPVWLQFILKSLFMLGIYMGTHFQCIGLTGGIATGKSTVSGLLQDNGFDIIDTD
jgi:Dephospho-CoA kinase